MRTNSDIASLLEEIADLLDLDGENPFRVRAYRNAAKTVRGLPGPAEDAKLTSLGGIGDVLASKIIEMSRTGSCEALERAREKWPNSLRGLLVVPGLGPKRTRVLHEELGVKNIADLRRVVDQGLLKSIPALGPALEKKLQAALKNALPTGERFPLKDVVPTADDFLARVRALPGVSAAEVAGSLRRRRKAFDAGKLDAGKATVGDVDIVACADDGHAIVAAFVAFPGVRTVLGAGDTRGSVLLDSGLQVDLRVVSKPHYGSALLYLTGSRIHAIELRSAAIKLGLKLNEYGVWDGEKKLAGETEQSMYAALGLPWLEPEDRDR